jgi:hypothetical protein
MAPQQQFGFKELFTHVIGDMARAICERSGESTQQQFVRTQAATHMILGLQPRDVIEAMLAGHCVMFHSVMTDSIHDTLRGEMDTMRRGTRANIVALNRAFHINLDRLARYQTRPSEGTRDGQQETEAQAQTATADRTRREASSGAAAARAGVDPTPAAETRTQSQTAPSPPVGSETPAVSEAPAPFQPSPEQIDACRANPEAMAALEAGDAERFARAMGVDQSESWPATAALPANIPGQTAASQSKPSRAAQVHRP